MFPVVGAKNSGVGGVRDQTVTLKHMQEIKKFKLL